MLQLDVDDVADEGTIIDDRRLYVLWQSLASLNSRCVTIVEVNKLLTFLY